MLTKNQEEFVKGIIEGKSQAEAYRAAYPKQRNSDKTTWEKASRLAADDKVKARIKELRDKIASESIMTARERLEYLTRVIKGEEKEKILQVIDGETVEVEVPSSLKVKVNALDIMNKMTGEYTTKISGDISIKKLEDLL